MKKLHVSELTDGEFTAVFQAAAEDAVARIRARGEVVPSMSVNAAKKQGKANKQTAARAVRKKAVA